MGELKLKKMLYKTTLLMGLSTLLLTGCFNDNEVKRLKRDVDELTAQVTTLKDKNVALYEENTSLKELRSIEYEKITDLDKLPLYVMQYNTTVPAYGPSAWLNTPAINFEGNINVLENNNGFTKIELVGYLPSWILDEVNNPELKSINKEYYIIKDTWLYLSPNNDEHKLRELSSGIAVRAEYELNGYTYITQLSTASPNDVISGWVDNRNLGAFTELDDKNNMDIHIPIGTEVYIYENESLVNQLSQELLESPP